MPRKNRFYGERSTLPIIHRQKLDLSIPLAGWSPCGVEDRNPLFGGWSLYQLREIGKIEELR